MRCYRTPKVPESEFASTLLFFIFYVDLLWMIDNLSLPSGYYEKTSNDEIRRAQISVSAQSTASRHHAQSSKEVAETQQVITLVGASAPAFSTETKL